MRKKSKKIFVLFVAFIMVLTLTILPGCGDEKAEMSMTKEVDAYAEIIDMDFAFNTAKDLSTKEDLLSSENGFRTAGSDAEHKGADYIAGVMGEIGLEEIEKIPVEVDKWEFRGGSFTMDGVETFMPISSASNGTDQDGITAEVVDVGEGKASDYEGKDVEGKIVIASVDQWNEYWINLPLEEANLQGAAAIITYTRDGYAQVSDDAVNMQDICTRATIPCVSVSKKQGEAIIAAAKTEGTQATLVVDNILQPGEGTSYNVVGKIKGKSDAQQIILSSHYDVYFYGFQDNCAAVSLVLSVAKGLLDSGYEPENDIVIVCHGAEEWGTSGTEFDWAVGSWKLIQEAKPEWAENTIAVLNFELPAYSDDAEQLQARSVPEYQDIVKTFVEDSGFIPESEGEIFPEGMMSETDPAGTYDDNISYRFSGIPTITNKHNYGNGWYTDHYHTAWDTEETYNEDVFQYNIQTYGSLLIMLDKMPAMPLNFEATYDYLKEATNEDIAKAAGVDIDSYNTALESYKEAAAAYTAKINDINERYETAALEGDEEEMKKIRKEGEEINKTSRAAYKALQDEFYWLNLSESVHVKHGAAQDNIETMQGVVKALEEGVLYNDDESGALDLAWNINGGAEYTFYGFSKQVGTDQIGFLTESENPGKMNWGTGKVSPLVESYDATISLLGKKDGDDFASEIAVYNREIEKQQAIYKQYMDEEIKALKSIEDMLK